MSPWIVMRKGIYLNRLLEKRMFLVVSSGIILGAIFHNDFVTLKPIVPWVFAYMTFTIALSSGSRDFINALRKPWLYLLVFFGLHIALPLLATVLSRIFLPSHPPLQAGIILGTAIPIGVTSTIWVNIAQGNSAFSLTSAVLDTVLSPIIVPLVILVTVGASIQFDVKELMLGLCYMIVIPTICGVIIHDLTKGTIKRKVSYFTGPSSKFLLALVIAINMASAWNSLHLIKSSLGFVIITSFLMSCSGYLLGLVTGKLMKLSIPMINTFIFTIGMRNITAGLVMALSYFPEATAIPVVFAIMFQQPLAAVSLKFLTVKETKEIRMKHRLAS